MSAWKAFQDEDSMFQPIKTSHNTDVTDSFGRNQVPSSSADFTGSNFEVQYLWFTVSVLVRVKSIVFLRSTWVPIGRTLPLRTPLHTQGNGEKNSQRAILVNVYSHKVPDFFLNLTFMAYQIWLKKVYAPASCYSKKYKPCYWPTRSAMSSISTFHSHKLSIVLTRYYVDGGRVGRRECHKDAMKCTQVGL